MVTLHRVWRVFLFLGLNGIVSGMSSPIAIAAAPPYTPQELILRFKHTVQEKDKASLLAEMAASTIRILPRTRIHQVRLAILTVDDALRRYQNDPRLEYVEPNYQVRLCAVPNDPLFESLWNLRNEGQSEGTPGADISAVPAWDISHSADGILVAVVDSGIDYIHQDLAANMYINPDEIPENGMDDDENGFVDDFRGWNFAVNNNNPKDNFGHGTAIAGIIGAVGDNGSGVVGVAWDVTIMPVKWAQGFTGNLADVLAATEYATTMSVDVMNHSWGENFSTPPASLVDVFQDANDAGILLVCAAGNEGQDIEVQPFYPAGLDMPNIVSVAASDPDDTRPSFSNYGSQSVDLAAPGFEIVSTLLNDGYGLFGVGGPFLPGTGTSFAAPHVAGAMALMSQQLPDLSATVIKDRLLATVDPLPSFSGVVLSGGRLNLQQALVGPDTISPAAVQDLVVAGINSNWIVLEWSATGDDGLVGQATAYDVRYATYPLHAFNFGGAQQAAGEPSPELPGTLQEMQIAGLDPSTLYYLAIKVLDEHGNASEISNVVNVTTLGPPVISVWPESFTIEMESDETTTQVLSISNSGPGALEFELSAGESWLTFAPPSGSVVSGGNQDVTLTIDATGLCEPEHSTELTIASNDPLQPGLSIPMLLYVTGIPDMAVSTTALDFGAAFIGLTVLDSVLVTNQGCVLLEVTDIQSDHPDFDLTPASFTLTAGESRAISLAFTPTSEGTLDAVTTIHSNDPDQPLTELTLHGVGQPAPDLQVIPDTLAVEVASGESLILPLVLTNQGGSGLEFEVFLEVPPGAPSPGRLCRPILAAVLDSRGADNETQTWDHLNANWHLFGDQEIVVDYATLNLEAITYTDLVSSGADVLIIANANSAFYGWEFSDVELAAIRSYVNLGHGLLVTAGTLNDSEVPNHSSVLAPLLGLSNEHAFNSVMMNPSPMFILVPDHPLFTGMGFFYLPAWQYSTLPGSGDWLTMVDGGEVVAISAEHFKAVVAHGNRTYVSAPPEQNSQPDDYRFIYNAICNGVTGGATWLTSDTRGGAIPPGESLTVNVTVGGEGLCSGTYLAHVVLHSNDVDQPEFKIPCQAQILGYPTLFLSQTAFDFGEVFVGLAVEDTFVVTNTGVDTLDVIAVESDNNQFRAEPTSFQLGIEENQEVIVTFDPATLGDHSAVISLLSNDPVMPAATVDLQGIGIGSPTTPITPDSLDEFLPVGIVTTRNLTLTNAGDSDLVFDSGAVPMSSGDSSLKSTGFTVFGDDMEHGVDGWTTVVFAGSDLWHQTQQEHRSPASSWWCGLEGQGDYDTGTRVFTALVSPVIDLLFFEGPYRLKFFEKIDTQPGVDRCLVEYTSNGGGTWLPLRGGASGNSGGWFQTILNLPDLGGAEIVQIRFVFDTGNGEFNDYPGWFIDDFALVADASIWLDLVPGEGVVPPGGSLSVTVFFDTTSLTPGAHEMLVGFQSNDPANPIFQVPVTLTVHEDSPAVEVQITAGMFADTGDLLGVQPGATDDFDPTYDVPEPDPPASGYVTGYSDHPDWQATLHTRLQRDMRALYDPVHATKSWWYVVQTDQLGSVQLRFSPNFTVTAGWELRLRDSLTGVSHDLLSDPTYGYEQLAPGARLFEILLGPPIPLLAPLHRSLPAGLSLVGIPLYPAPARETWQDVLLDDASGEVMLFGYGGEDTYQLVAVSDTVQVGQGVWAAASEGLIWTMEGVRDLDGVSVPLDNGWSLVGYPLWVGGDLAGVFVDHAEVRYTYSEATTVGLVSSVVFGYNTTTGGVDLVTSLQTWHGYWIAGFVEDLSLWFDVHDVAVGYAATGMELRSRSEANTQAEGQSGEKSGVPGNILVKMQSEMQADRSTRSKAEVATEAEARARILPGWFMSARVIGSVDTITFGALIGATVGFDATWDLPSPPPPPGGYPAASISLYHPEWNLSTGDLFRTDFVSADRLPRFWQAQVSSPAPGVVGLTWQESGMPADLDLRLVLVEEDSIVVPSMKDTSLAQLEVGTFPLLVAFQVVEVDEPEPDAALHLYNAPNPSNPSTEFRFVLPRPGHTEIRIYNVRGALVSTIEGGVLPSGPAQLAWQGYDQQGMLLASGTYFYRLYLDGKQAGQTRKLSFVK